MSTNTRRVTLLFPKVNDNDDKRSNYRQMSVLCLQEKPYLLISANLQSNKRHAYIHLSKREIFHSYKKSREFFTFPSFLDQLSCIQVTA